MCADLRHYSQQIERDLKAVENQSIEEYIRESENIANLHSQIGDCDNILERMESMLTNFQVIRKIFLEMYMMEMADWSNCTTFAECVE